MAIEMRSISHHPHLLNKRGTQSSRALQYTKVAGPRRAPKRNTKTRCLLQCTQVAGP
ncbi:hypothetical protein COLO4_05612 [Corchorus olitorius]|uniref:Uncharacterized protein n=1 Tax=Corchorus olitorius TaxID=93759 RepID=A0A1R3KQH7_9ROSI|nr:hypothetical protein COLO4_05612 [Corchorus olitorius]